MILHCDQEENEIWLVLVLVCYDVMELVYERGEAYKGVDLSDPQ